MLDYNYLICCLTFSISFYSNILLLLCCDVCHLGGVKCFVKKEKKYNFRGISIRSVLKSVTECQ